MKLNNLILLAAMTLAASCGRRNGKDGLDGGNGASGAKGDIGNVGLPGLPGANGHNTVLSMVSFSGVSGSCTNGGVTILSGLDANDSGSLDSGDSSLLSSTVCNGTNGANGSNGSNGADGADAPINNFTPVAIIDPCGDAPGIYDEVMLRLYNGQLLASFSDNINGYNTRFSILGAGSYQTTDGSNCHFTVDALGNVN